MNKTISSLVQAVAKALETRNLKIVLAESCTGGLLAAHLTSLSGSSRWFERGYVSYSNEAKQESIGIAPSLIAKYGAVSAELAQAMAQGALSHSRAQVSIAITGIAGPEGGTLDKPVGMVCFAWAIPRNGSVHVCTKTQHFSGDRHRVRDQACAYALQELLDLLEENHHTN
jgi:nicotinamide-nucleotide amidase